MPQSLKVCGCVVLLSLLALAPGVNARADVVALSITPNPNNTFNNGSGYSLGYEFHANSNMTVTQVGYFANPGLTETHNIGIYTAGGTLVTASTVTSADPLTVNFRYHALASSVTLTAGQDYFIMGSSGVVDPYTFTPTAISTNAALTFLQSGFALGNSLAFPTVLNDISNGYFGPNFQFTTAASVPEPSTLTLCGLTAISGLAVAWRKPRRVA
jgi:hypothetical protein